MPLAPSLTKFTTTSPKLVNYNWEDVAEGTGIVKFYALHTVDDQILSTQPIYSASIESTGTVTSNDWTIITDTDFDLAAFNMPKTLKGTATVVFGYNYDQSGFGYCRFTFYVRKWDGANEIEIASGVYTKSNAPDEKRAASIAFAIPQTNFKAGDILRFSIKTEARDDGAPPSPVRVTIGHDPQNRDGTYIIPSTDSPKTTTKLEFYCPFELT